ncbi:hypothetical protein ANANG_G00128970 [Anguilla anguilla]|uniref:Pre-mRNA 3' end processing protein WDR33 n=1 Tax=Anguilla anguilla TaxID=7936 RepID=A0A9D3MEY3_ANGAN|nr:hypothetical protein ANANG_G00128970 [Anguilla anguilla]
MLSNPMNAVTTKFVRTSTNKVKCPVFVVRWTPEGRRLVTGASSGEFTLWNGLTFNFETILQAHDSPVRAMTWSHNDMWMLTADHGGYVKYWQSNMNNVKMFQAHKEAIREASFSPTDNKFATCSDDGTVRIWDFLRCHEERILRGHGADVKCVDWHPTKGLVVSGSKDSQQPIKFWDPKTGQSLATLHAHKNTVMEELEGGAAGLQGHKKEATAVAWHPVHEGLFASGGSDGSLLFWNAGVEKEVGGMEMAHEGMIWSLAWHPLGHILCSGSNDHTSKFWTRNRPGDKMRDRYNLNLLPGMSEDGVEYDDMEPNSLASIPGMGIPEQLKVAMEQEQSGKDDSEVEMTIPGLDWGMEEVMQKDQKKVPQKKVPYAKPIPAQFQQAWAENKVPTLPPGETPKERPDQKKPDMKKKTQAEIEQEMATLQYTNPLLLEQLKIERMAQKQSDQGAQQAGAQQGAMQPFPGQGPMPPPHQGFPQSLPPQQIPHNMPHMGPGGLQGPFIPQGQMGPPGPQLHQGPLRMGQSPGPQPMMPGMGQQGPNGKGEARGPPNHHLGPPPDRRGPEGPGGPDQGSDRAGQYWGDSREGRRGPPDYEGGDDRGGSEDTRFRGRREDRFDSYEGPGDDLDQRPREQRRPPHPRHGQDADDTFRRVGPGRPEARGGRGYADEFGVEESFDPAEETGRSWDSSGRGRSRGGGARGGAGGRKGLLPTPDEFPAPHYEGGRNSESWEGGRDQGHEAYRDAPRADHAPRDSPSPASRERSSSLQGMDMASLPPRKRPWHGPGDRHHGPRQSGRPSHREEGAYGVPSRAVEGAGAGRSRRARGGAARAPPRGGSPPFVGRTEGVAQRLPLTVVSYPRDSLPTDWGPAGGAAFSL